MTTPLSIGGGGWQSATPTGVLAKASLYEKDNDASRVTFSLNPEQIHLDHHAKVTQASGPLRKGTKRITIPKDSGKTTFSIYKLQVEGADVTAQCLKLMSWTDQLAKPGKDPELPKLVFSWGLFKANVELTSLSIVFDRFTYKGVPISAALSITCTTYDDPPVRTNPSSGGIAGRRSHVLVAGENLQHVATAQYGRATAWRALAAVNGIEDPLAVRPGTVIYLPSPDELGELGDGSRS
jgi:nucleoid-associated protein YgaU